MVNTYSIENRFKHTVIYLLLYCSGGDHYDSIRRIGDTGHLPAAIHINIETHTNESAKVESYEEHSSSNNSSEATYGSFNVNEVDPENPVSLFLFVPKKKCIIFNIRNSTLGGKRN